MFCPELFGRRIYRAPIAFAAFGFFLALLMFIVLFCSIHWSRIVFLNFQRLPSLNAGIFSSVTYLYSVSGLTPRYCEACLMFITSRESAAINVSLSTVGLWPSTRPVEKSFCLLCGRRLVEPSYIWY